MLLSKNILHIAFFIDKQKYCVQLCMLLYSFLSSKSSVFISSLLSFKSQYRLSAMFLYSFNLKLSVPSVIFLNIVLAKLYSSCNNIFKTGFKMQINTYKRKPKAYTVLRSPFVYKKSREQLLITTNNVSIFFYINTKCILLVEYLEFLLWKYTCFVSGTRVLVLKKKLIK